MTQAQAQNCVAAIVGAGFFAQAMKLGDGSWQVKALAPDYSITSAQVNTLAAQQSVSNGIAEVIFK